VVDVGVREEQVPHHHPRRLDVVEHGLPLRRGRRPRVHQRRLDAVVEDVAVLGERADDEGTYGHRGIRGSGNLGIERQGEVEPSG